MPTYRAYLLDPAGKITWGEWFEADDEAEARRIASTRCKAGVPTIELWQGATRIAGLACGEPDTKPQ